MREVGDAGHLNLDGHGDLALNLFGAAARPLGDDLDVVVGDVGIGFDGQVAKGDDAPRGENDTPPSTSQRLFSAKSTRARIIYWFPAVSSRSALVTTCWPV